MVHTGTVRSTEGAIFVIIIVSIIDPCASDGSTFLAVIIFIVDRRVIVIIVRLFLVIALVVILSVITSKISITADGIVMLISIIVIAAWSGLVSKNAILAAMAITSNSDATSLVFTAAAAVTRPARTSCVLASQRGDPAAGGPTTASPANNNRMLAVVMPPRRLCAASDAAPSVEHVIHDAIVIAAALAALIIIIHDAVIIVVMMIVAGRCVPGISHRQHITSGSTSRFSAARLCRRLAFPASTAALTVSWGRGRRTAMRRFAICITGAFAVVLTDEPPLPATCCASAAAA